MARTVVFLVHGMGDHQDRPWHEEWVTALKGHFETLDGTALTRRSFEELYEFVPITYDGIFRDLLDQWRQEGAALDDAKLELGASLGLFQLLQSGLEAAGGGGFFWTHAADVLLYRAIPFVRERVRVVVAKTIVDALIDRAEPASGDLPSWGIIAHSLGTAVAHDALHALWTAAFTHPELERVAPDKSGGHAKLVAMIANVSRVLQHRAVKVYESTVMPGPITSVVPGRSASESEWFRGCEYYLSARHRLDPFTRPKPFQPDPIPWPDQQALSEERFIHVADQSHIRDANVHAFTHHLADPKVHIPILELLFRVDSVGEDHKKRAEHAFREKHPLDATLVEKIKDRLEGIGSSENLSWAEFGDLRRRFEEQVLALEIF